MKKTIRLAVLLLTLATCVVGFTVCSNKSNDRFGIIEDESSGLTFMLDEETESYSVVNCDEWRTEIVIPSEFNRRSVTAIGNRAFKECSLLISVTIPDTITDIGEEAFYGCRSLTSIEIPNNVTSIGNGAFWNCDNLQYNEYDNALYLGNATNKYLYLAKAKSKDITGCIINENCKFIGSSAFSGCNSLTNIVIPDSVTSIGEDAFYKCSSLTSVTFEQPDGWFVAWDSTATSGIDLDLSDAEQNATYLKSTYIYYDYWYKK